MKILLITFCILYFVTYIALFFLVGPLCGISFLGGGAFVSLVGILGNNQ